MIVDSSQFRDLYDAVRQDKHQSDNKNILVFVSNSDVDAVCSARQLQDIFKADDTNFSVNPVESYEEIAAACVNIKDTTELCTIFMINCGATENVRGICGFEHNDNVRVIIIDSHRPVWHGYNDSIPDTIVVVDKDDPVPASQIPVAEEGDHFLREGNTAQYVRFMRRKEEGEDDDDEDAGPMDDDSESTRRLKEYAKLRTAELWSYYSERSGLGKPSALLLFDLARALNIETMTALWLAILGLTDQLVYQRINRDDYERWRKTMEISLQQLQGGAALQDTTNLSSMRHDTLTVARVTDLRLVLLRHWNLHDSLLYSGYTASRMQTWTEKGRGNVKLLLAKMSVPLDQAIANCTNMQRHMREKIPVQLDQHGMEFGLNTRALKVDGFELKYKNDVQFAATDMVMMISSTLGRPREDASDTKMGFHDASEILDVDRSLSNCKSSMERVKHVNKEIVMQGGLAISRNQVHASRKSKFWHLDMSDLDIASKQDFQHPTTLYQLALFLRDAMSRRYSVAKAMVVIGPPDKEGRCYIVAIRAKEVSGSMQNNPFARPLEEVMDSLRTTLPRSLFDSSLYHIRKADAHAVLEELKVILERYDQDERLVRAAAAAP